MDDAMNFFAAHPWRVECPTAGIFRANGGGYCVLGDVTRYCSNEHLARETAEKIGRGLHSLARWDGRIWRVYDSEGMPAEAPAAHEAVLA